MINKVYGLLGLAARARKVVSGTDACIQEIKKNGIKLLIVAEDASEKTKKNFQFYCKNSGIPIYIFGNIEELSKTIGKSNKAIIGIKEENFSKEIVRIINGGEIIG